MGGLLLFFLYGHGTHPTDHDAYDRQLGLYKGDQGRPGGRISSPVGPMDPATRTRRSAESATSLPIAAAAAFNWWTRPSIECNFRRWRFPPKEFVRMMSDPAST